MTSAERECVNTGYSIVLNFTVMHVMLGQVVLLSLFLSTLYTPVLILASALTIILWDYTHSSVILFCCVDQAPGVKVLLLQKIQSCASGRETV